MDRERNVGEVRCTLCSEHYAVKIHALSEPIDVYRWVGGTIPFVAAPFLATNLTIIV
jgi:transcription elongation factor Elf1